MSEAQVFRAQAAPRRRLLRTLAPWVTVLLTVGNDGVGIAAKSWLGRKAIPAGWVPKGDISSVICGNEVVATQLRFEGSAGVVLADIGALHVDDARVVREAFERHGYPVRVTTSWDDMPPRPTES